MVQYIDVYCIYCSIRWYIEMWIEIIFFFWAGGGGGGGVGGVKFVLWLEFYLLDLFFSTKLLGCMIEPDLIICPWVFLSSLPPQHLHNTLEPNIRKLRIIFFNTHAHTHACVFMRVKKSREFILFLNFKMDSKVVHIIYFELTHKISKKKNN